MIALDTSCRLETALDSASGSGSWVSTGDCVSSTGTTPLSSVGGGASVEDPENAPHARPTTNSISPIQSNGLKFFIYIMPLLSDDWFEFTNDKNTLTNY
jgi:hypothetical protein